jgi:hypothetical protein
MASHALLEDVAASLATIDEPSATMPANSTQPAMVLKRSSMNFP